MTVMTIIPQEVKDMSPLELAQRIHERARSSAYGQVEAIMMIAEDIMAWRDAESEACAKVADRYGGGEPVAREIADVIRERTKQQ